MDMRVSKYKRRRIGNRVGTVSTKEYLSVFRSTNINSRTLYSYNITKIPESMSNDNNERRSARANIRGFRFYWRISNANHFQPYYLSWAVVQMRDNPQVSENTTGFTGNLAAAATDPWASRFFSDKVTEHGSTAFSTDLDSLVLNRYPLNPEKFTVLVHKKLIINIKNPPDTYPSNTHQREKGSSFHIKKFYLPLKRQINWYGASSASQTDKLFLIFWCDRVDAAATAPVDTNALTTNLYVHSVFRDTK